VISQTASIVVSLNASQPSWSVLLHAASMLTRLQKRKLILRYHPDKLAHELSRQPTEEEIKMSNLAMSVLNLLFSDNCQANEKSIMAAMKELNTLYIKYNIPKPKTSPNNIPPEQKDSSHQKTQSPKKAKAKRNPTVYNLFVREKMPEVRAKHPNSRPSEHMTMVAAIWRAMSTEDKDLFRSTCI
jgi:hypothetical protein